MNNCYRFWLLCSLFLMVALFALYRLNEQYHVIAMHGEGEKDDCQLRVLTWNIHGTKQLCDRQQSAMARLIIAQDADLILLNEFTMDSCLVLDSVLSAYYPHKEGCRAKVIVGDIIYSRKRLVESGKYNSQIPGIDIQVIYAKICVKEDSVYFLGCHLHGNNSEGPIGIDDTDSLRHIRTFWGRYLHAQEKRKKSASLFKNTIRENSMPMIVMGDMNDFQHSAPMDSLRDAGLRNAWWEGGLGYGATYHKGWLRLRIDHIYYNNKLMLRDVKVVKTELSDHNIMTADFSIAK